VQCAEMGMTVRALFVYLFNFLFYIFSLLNDAGSISHCIASNYADELERM
jgi:hypothetical protein